MMKLHILAFFIGFILDLLLGDPHSLPHPIRLIGSLISGLEKSLLKEQEGDKRLLVSGFLLVVLVIAITDIVVIFILFGAYMLHPVFGVVIESIMTYQILATRSLFDESMKVYRSLCAGDVEGARQAVAMIVGRDTKALDEKGIVRACVETVAENTSDGVIAPMLYTALGGPVLGFTYKAINTMDSMVGYKNQKYQFFGRAAAKLDDAVNYMPARISAYMMIFISFLLYGFDAGSRAIHIYRRDRRKHASPNSAHTESVCAGALGVQLAGDASYFGTVVHKPHIGDSARDIEVRDIVEANKMMCATAFLCEAVCLLIMGLLRNVI